MDTQFWLIRHALVSENERARLYGVQDVSLCPDTLAAQVPQYTALANRLPFPAHWFCTPLSRTRRTAEAIFAAGYPTQEMTVVPGLIEQHLGEFQGLAHDDLPPRLMRPPHPFWPLAADEEPPGGESFVAMIDRVGETLETMAREYRGESLVVVSHGGAIRAAVGHAMEIAPDRALRFAVHNISLTRLDHTPRGWRVGCVNEWPGI